MGTLAFSLIVPLLAALKQKLVVYGLMAVSGLVLVFAVGYGLDAVHSMLLFHFGGVAASLIIAGSLFVTALVAAGTALILNGRPSPRAALKSSPYSHPPARTALSRESATAIAAAVAGAVTAGTVVASSQRLRSYMAGRRLADDDSL